MLGGLHVGQFRLRREECERDMEGIGDVFLLGQDVDPILIGLVTIMLSCHFHVILLAIRRHCAIVPPAAGRRMPGCC